MSFYNEILRKKTSRGFYGKCFHSLYDWIQLYKLKIGYGIEIDIFIWGNLKSYISMSFGLFFLFWIWGETNAENLRKLQIAFWKKQFN